MFSNRFLPLFFLFMSFIAGLPLYADSKPARFQSRTAPEGATVYFISPQNGETLSNPVTVKFGLKGMGVAPAGVDHPKTGHHHLLIDLNALPPENEPMAASDHIKHFGGGQTETTLELSKGQHTLQLILGDYLHVPFAPPMASKKITITVK